ncbi:glycoside hydrolase family 104 protein [Cupriavidus respiraculi]|uniref:glycoside hydrolase family 24 protein n=1 Tax=Cupriavidus respiraculi TaxID=195930 RepID=UPI001C9515F5|nr:glycoside hydrolase family 104 protein [Cupriavidus respiraculi]MBY4945401.1 glycoside hydrolase family 104 protein [Cupriavidus respiraculi]
MPYTDPDRLPGGQNMAAFLDMLGFSEGTVTVAGSDDGYNVNVGGLLFSSYRKHPRCSVPTRWGLSDAAGRYQIMAAIPGKIRTDTWDWASRACGVADFTPESQDKVAVYLVARRGALDDLQKGKFADAVRKCRHEWASLPGAGYGQREHRLELLLERYIAFGGTDIGP